MTPAEIIQRDLRDIILPPLPPSAVGEGFYFTPLLVAIALVVGLFLLSRWRRERWRRQAAEALHQANRIEQLSERWQALVHLRKQATKHKKLPDPPNCLFWPLERIGKGEAELLAGHLQQALRR